MSTRINLDYYSNDKSCAQYFLFYDFSLYPRITTKFIDILLGSHDSIEECQIFRKLVGRLLRCCSAELNFYKPLDELYKYVKNFEGINKAVCSLDELVVIACGCCMDEFETALQDPGVPYISGGDYEYLSGIKRKAKHTKNSCLLHDYVEFRNHSFEMQLRVINLLVNRLENLQQNIGFDILALAMLVEYKEDLAYQILDESKKTRDTTKPKVGFLS